MHLILEKLAEHMSLGPDRMTSTADGGIDVYFFSAVRMENGTPACFVNIAVDSDGNASVLFRRVVPDEMIAEEIVLDTLQSEGARDLANRIEEFLLGVEETTHTRRDPTKRGAL